MRKICIFLLKFDLGFCYLHTTLSEICTSFNIKICSLPKFTKHMKISIQEIIINPELFILYLDTRIIVCWFVLLIMKLHAKSFFLNKTNNSYFNIVVSFIQHYLVSFIQHYYVSFYSKTFWVIFFHRVLMNANEYSEFNECIDNFQIYDNQQS